MEHWWLRFGEVRWHNFGRREATATIEILDRWAGRKLWSWKRWKFSLWTCLAVLALVSLWTFFRAYFINHDWRPPTRDMEHFTTAIVYPASVVMFALSASATRLIAQFAAAVSTSATSTIGAFVLMLIVHVGLLLYWSAFTVVFLIVPVLVASQVLMGPDKLFADITMSNIVPVALFAASKFLPEHHGWLPVPRWESLLSPFAGFDGFLSSGMDAFKVAMDFVANGIRILFALAFLSSFVFGPLIQGPILALWYGIMTSPRGLFTALFTVIGVAVGVVKVALK